MRRLRQSWLVVVAGEAQATFDDYADASAYADDVHGSGDVCILPLPHWPAGLWRYGIESPASPAPDGRLDYDPAGQLPRRVSPVAQAAHEAHVRASRRCHGSDLGVITSRYSPPRYSCQRCGDRIL